MDWLLVVLLMVACNGGYVLAEDFRFLGAGYDLIHGNPDGGSSGTGSSHGGTDPGILATRKIFITDATNSVTSSRSACENNENIYEHSKAYQEKLEMEINVAAEASYTGVSFAASAGFKGAQDQTTKSHSLVFEKNTLCFTGSERYKLTLVDALNYLLTDSFAGAVCALGTSYTADKTNYMNFLKKWGTHVITEVDLGYRTIERKKTSVASLFEYAESTIASAVSFSAESGVASGSLAVDVSVFKSSESFKETFTSSLASYTIGSSSLPEPIKLTLASIRDFLDNKYWSNFADLRSRNICPTEFRRATIEAQLGVAIEEYPEWLEVESVQAVDITIPLKWPKGTFGLPMPRLECVRIAVGIWNEQNACPSGTWYTGSRFQDTEDDDGLTIINPAWQCLSDSWGASGATSNGVTLKTCAKHEATGTFRLNWPKGSYCIYKEGNCPSGFTFGKIYWDDEDDNNANKASGHLPDGTYNGNTLREFCCRDDGYYTAGIYLPIEKPFILFAKSQFCQKVNGMNAEENTIFWDDEDDSNSNSRTGSVPYLHGVTTNTKLTFCYYTKA